MNQKEITNKVLSFRDERDWKQFHTLKDLCLGIGIEVAELQELFLWKTKKQIDELKVNFKETISDELADVYIYLIYISHEFSIDLNKAIVNKIEKNRKKYPVSKSKGNNTKYNKL